MKLLHTYFMLLLLCIGTAIHAQWVYKTPSGAKYHLATCRMVDNVSQKLTVEQAAEKGLAPCKICKPESIAVQQISPAAQTPQGQSTTVQCKGLTKKGTRCQHMTRIANGYCFQHNPDK